MWHVFALLGFSPLTGGLIVLALAAILLFELMMLVDAIRNPQLTSGARALWIVGMLLVHPFVAIAYYFTDYSRRDT